MMDVYLDQLKKSILQVSFIAPSFWLEIESLFSYKKLSRKELFCRERESPSHFGYLCSGILRMFHATENGKELTKHFIRQGEFFVGAVNYYDKNLVSIDALSEAHLLVANYRDIDRLALENPALGDFKNKVVSRYIQLKQQRENNHLNLDSEERYRIFLQEFPQLLNQIPHYYIAGYLGITPTQLSRVRKKMT